MIWLRDATLRLSMWRHGSNFSTATSDRSEIQKALWWVGIGLSGNYQPFNPESKEIFDKKLMRTSGVSQHAVERFLCGERLHPPTRIRLARAVERLESEGRVSKPRQVRP
jgi:hypothetical protein